MAIDKHDKNTLSEMLCSGFVAEQGSEGGLHGWEWRTHLPNSS